MLSAKTLTSLASAAILAGCGGGGGTKAPKHTPTGHRPAATSISTIASPTAASGQRDVLLVSLPTLGRLTAACRDGTTTVEFRSDPRSQTNTVSVTSRDIARTVTLDPGRRVRVSKPLRGVQLWQIAAISEGEVIVADATVSAARMPGSSQCFLNVRAEEGRRNR